MPYVALWCEHHEDFLAQCQDNRYDGYQIKTRRPENGAWRMHDPEVVRSIGRFVDLVRQFGDRIRNLFFVSNTAFDHCGDGIQDKERVRRRPQAFLTHVRACAGHAAIAAPYISTFTEIQAQCGCQPEELFAVLRRMDLINGPPRESFQPVVAHQHLTRLPDCGALPADELDGWCDALIAIVCAASSLAVSDPMQHLVPLIDNGGLNPGLAAKRLVVAEVMVRPTPVRAPVTFGFSDTPALAIGTASRPAVLQAKLEQGELADQVDYLRGRQRDTEYHLLEQAARSPEHFPRLLRRLEEVVLGECSEAHLRARMLGNPYGPRMMVDVQDRLRRIAEDEPARVGNQPYDCLMGMVGLLTSDTRVWWSPRFPVQEAPT